MLFIRLWKVEWRNKLFTGEAMLGKRQRAEMATGYIKRNRSWQPQKRPPQRTPPVRPWVVTSPAVILDRDEPDVFSLATFNVLAQDLLEDHLGSLYNHCPPQFLEWEYRKLGIMSLLTSCSADVLCLQEVQEDHYKDTFLPQLQHHGFDGIYQKRTGGKFTDGCALFYRHLLFDLVDYKQVQYFNHDSCAVLNRHNVGLIAKLKMKDINITVAGSGVNSKRQFCVATTHLLFNPKAGDIKLAQLSVLLAELHRMCSAPDGSLCASVLCGDLNCLPHCPLLRFITTGRLEYEGLCAAEIAGYSKRKNRKIPVPLLPPNLSISQDCRFVTTNSTPVTISSTQVTDTSDQQTPNINGDATKEPKKELATMTHGFNFESAYKVMDGVHSASATTYHCAAMEMVDYIFYTPSSDLVNPPTSSSLRLLSRCVLPSNRTLMELGPMPNEFLTSDHLHLQAQFQLLY